MALGVFENDELVQCSLVFQLLYWQRFSLPGPDCSSDELFPIDQPGRVTTVQQIQSAGRRSVSPARAAMISDLRGTFTSNRPTKNRLWQRRKIVVRKSEAGRFSDASEVGFAVRNKANKYLQAEIFGPLPRPKMSEALRYDVCQNGRPDNRRRPLTTYRSLVNCSESNRDEGSD